MSADRPRVAIFARAPVRGEVKTRLARTIGDEAALGVYRELLSLTLNRLAPGSGNFTPEIWIDRESPSSDPWPQCFRVVVQPEGDLGVRMAAAFEDGVTALVGSDIPLMSAGYVEQAVNALSCADVVLGPTEDGGYCLVAMRRPQPAIFAGIPWSTPRVLDATLSAADEGDLSVELLEVMWDVDDAHDLDRWRRCGA